VLGSDRSAERGDLVVHHGAYQVFVESEVALLFVARAADVIVQIAITEMLVCKDANTGTLPLQRGVVAAEELRDG